MCIYNPCSWGKKNPISHLSRMKTPDLPCSSVAAALRAYSYVLRPVNYARWFGVALSDI